MNFYCFTIMDNREKKEYFNTDTIATSPLSILNVKVKSNTWNSILIQHGKGRMVDIKIDKKAAAYFVPRL